MCVESDWKEQLRKYANIRKLKALEKKDWKKRAEKRIKRDKEEAERKSMGQEDDKGFKTNNPAFADADYRKVYNAEIRKALGIGRSYRAEAMDRIKRAFHYMPGTKSIITSDLA